MNLSQAEKIRIYVLERKIEPARQRGDKLITIFAREIHAEMHLNAPIQAVCTAIDHDEFERFANVQLLERSAQKRSTKSKWVFAIQ
jgi:hypothetical protein